MDNEPTTTRALSVGTFHALRELIARETGIALNDGKRNFVAARLQHRLRSLQLASYDEYYVYAKTHVEERQRLINAITTNKTSFYRESHHFEMLTNDLGRPPKLSKNIKYILLLNISGLAG